MTVLAIGFWGAMTALCAAAFANNVAVIVRWWTAFRAAGGDPTKMPAEIAGVLPWLDWSAVDYSAVSTFIPLLGCALVTKGLVDLARKRRRDPESFPFFPSMDQFNVALGLFGTLWGIIVIGYFSLDKVGMGDLMHCLHTALFSTLVAVVWVFVIDHPLIRPWMRSRLAKAGLCAAEDADISTVLDKLILNLDRAAERAAVLERKLETLGEAVSRDVRAQGEAAVAQLKAVSETVTASMTAKAEEASAQLKAVSETVTASMTAKAEEASAQLKAASETVSASLTAKADEAAAQLKKAAASATASVEAQGQAATQSAARLAEKFARAAGALAG